MKKIDAKKIDAKKIETLSVNAVKDSIIVTDFLDQFINDNDKEPSWDGFVYIYNESSKTKEHFKGRIPVQIKGKQCNDFMSDEITYRMKIVDLKSYLADGGVILFVVYINSNNDKQIYYAELSPVKLKILLENIGTKKTTSVSLKKFPLNNDEKTTIFFNFYQNCVKQTSFIYEKLPTMEELCKMDNVESFSIPYAYVGKKDPKKLLFDHDMYVYANIKGSAIMQPIQMLMKNLRTQEIIQKQISIDDVVYYSNYEVIESSKDIIINIGNSFTITLNKSTRVGKINYKDSSSLRNLVKDLDFMLNYIKKGDFYIGKVKIPFDKDNYTFDNFDIAKENKKLNFYRKVIQALEYLNYYGDINISNLTNKEADYLFIITRAFVDKKPVRGFDGELPAIIYLPIRDLKFALIAKKKDESDEYWFSDFFRDELKLFCKQGDENIPISQYAIYGAKNLLEITNLRIDNFLKSFQDIDDKSKYSSANDFLLKLLQAYDISKGERKDLLNAAYDFSSWLMASEESNLDNNIKIINFYQTIRRMRDLDENEKEVLWNIINNQSNPSIKVGAALLLCENGLARQYFYKLSLEEREEFEKYPIFHFWI